MALMFNKIIQAERKWLMLIWTQVKKQLKSFYIQNQLHTFAITVPTSIDVEPVWTMPSMPSTKEKKINSRQKRVEQNKTVSIEHSTSTMTRKGPFHRHDEQWEKNVSSTDENMFIGGYTPKW